MLVSHCFDLMVWNARLWSRGICLEVFRIFSFLTPERGVKSLAMCVSFHLVDVLSLNSESLEFQSH